MNIHPNLAAAVAAYSAAKANHKQAADANLAAFNIFPPDRLVRAGACAHMRECVFRLGVATANLSALAEQHLTPA